MNQNPTAPSPFGTPTRASLETLQSRYALRVAARLTERTGELSPDITERLRFAREKALERAREARTAAAPVVVGVSRGGAAVFGGSAPWWLKAASILPVFALLAGLLLIQQAQVATQISVAAEVDADLLSDALPPQAYSDPGFAEFLKTPAE